jgi:hypothetical protein
MFTITNKTLVAAAAVVAAGFVAAIDMAQSRTENAAATIAARFPSQAEMMVSLDAPQSFRSLSGKADKVIAPVGGCTREHWPYLADECLTATDGAKVKAPTRTITIERRIAGNTSQLVRVPVTQVAAR